MIAASSRGRGWGLTTVALLTATIVSTGNAATLSFDVTNVDNDGASSLVATDVPVTASTACGTSLTSLGDQTVRCVTASMRDLQRALCGPGVTRTIVVSPTDNIVISPTDNDSESAERTIVVSPTDNIVISPTDNDSESAERTIVVSPTDNIVISPTDNDSESAERTIVVSPTDNIVISPTDNDSESAERTIVVSPTDNIVISPTDNDSESPERTIVISPTDNRVAGTAICGVSENGGWTVVWWGNELAAIVTADDATTPILVLDKMSTLEADLAQALIDLGVSPDEIDVGALSHLARTLAGDPATSSRAFDSLEQAVTDWEDGACGSHDVLTQRLCAVLR